MRVSNLQCLVNAECRKRRHFRFSLWLIYSSIFAETHEDYPLRLWHEDLERVWGSGSQEMRLGRQRRAKRDRQQFPSHGYPWDLWGRPKANLHVTRKPCVRVHRVFLHEAAAALDANDSFCSFGTQVMRPPPRKTTSFNMPGELRVACNVATA